MAAPRTLQLCSSLLRQSTLPLCGRYLANNLYIGQSSSLRCIVSCHQRVTLDQNCGICKPMVPCVLNSLSSAILVNSNYTPYFDFSTSSARYQTETSHRECWKCGNTLHDNEENFFCRCGVIMPPRQEIDYFQLFGIERKFSLDEESLSQEFKDLQRYLHPDKFTQKSDIERQYSADQSSLVNKAYKTLIKPLSRGLYMLELSGHPIDEQTENTDLDPDFLMEIMEINEALAEADSVETVRDIGKRNNQVLERLLADLSMAFDKGDIFSAKNILMHLNYYDNIDSKVKELERNQF